MNSLKNYIEVVVLVWMALIFITACSPDNNSLKVRSGRYFYNVKCAICHAAGQEDTSNAFRASDLASKSHKLKTDLSVYGGEYKLMGQFSAVPQVNIDELKAYLSTL